MKNVHMLCSTLDDLNTLDHAHLRMNNIIVTDDLDKAISPILEGDAQTLILTDKAVEARGGTRKVSQLIHAAIGLNEGSIRVIYVKRGIEDDEISLFMDQNGLWDVYMNASISEIKVEQLIDMINNRKTRNRRFSDKMIDGYKDTVIRNANALSNNLLESLKEDQDLNTNMKFRSTLVNNLPLVRDLILGYEEMKKDLNLAKKDITQKDIRLGNMQTSFERFRIERETFDNLIKTLENNYSIATRELQELANKYNSLYRQVDTAVVASELSTNLAIPLNTDDYYDTSPVILYLKEITPVRYISDFVSSLNNIAIDSLKYLSKVVVIENDLHISKIPLYEKKGFYHLTNGTPMSQLVLGNLVTVGSNRKLLTHLLQNPLKLNLLIILDRSGTSNTLIEGDKVINFSLVKDMEDSETLNIPSAMVITNDYSGKFVLEDIPDYKAIENNYELKLSSVGQLNITRKLLVFIKEWDDLKNPDNFLLRDEQIEETVEINMAEEL